MDYITYWTDRAEIPAKTLLGWLELGTSKYHSWKDRYGKANEHNGKIPRDHWLEDWEKAAIVDYFDQHPLEGYRRLTFMMLDDDIVATSPATVYRVLKANRRLDRRKFSPSKKGTGFVQPLVFVPRAEASLPAKAIQETAEAVFRKFGSKAAKNAPALASKIESLAVRYGDDAVLAVRKVGPKAFAMASGPHAAQAVRVLARHGEQGAVRVLSRPTAMNHFLRYGFGMHSSLPVQMQIMLRRIVLAVDDDFDKNRSQDAFLGFRGCGGVAPEFLQVRPQFEQLLPILVAKNGDVGIQLGQTFFHLRHMFECCVPSCFEFRRHESVIRIDQVVLFLGSSRLIPSFL